MAPYFKMVWWNLVLEIDERSKLKEEKIHS